MGPDKKTGKLWRKQNKINKIKALLDVSTLNEKDRQEIAAFKSQQHLEMGNPKSETEGISDQFNNEEPKCKKFKADNGTALSPIDSKDNTSSTEENRPTFSENEKAELRKLLKKRREMLKRTPRFNLREVGIQAELNISATDRVPIFCSDLQHLVMHALFSRDAPNTRWFTIDSVGSIKNVQILFIEGAGISDYLRSQEQLTALSDSNFQIRLEVVMPAAYGGDTIEEFCSVPLSRTQGIRLVERFRSLENAVKTSKFQLYKVLRTFFPITKTLETEEEEKSVKPDKQKKSDDETPEEVKIDLPPTDKFPRTSLLLSAWQLIEEGYPILLNDNLKEQYKDFVFTKTSYKEVTNFSPMYGVDCEMCKTTNNQSELTRVSIVNEKLETVYDTLVLPPNKITNYLTEYSGITAAMMKDVTTRLKDVQKFIQENLEPDAILVGQSLNFDLRALKMIHPYCIDTSVVFNVTGDRYRKTKLKILSQHFLNEIIQAGRHGHCSVEDSTAALRLVQLKLSKSVEFGDQVLSSQSCSDVKKTKEPLDVSGYATSLFHHTSVNEQHVTITACPEIVEKYVDYVNPKILSCKEVNEDGTFSTLVTHEDVGGQVTCFVTSSNENVTQRVATEESLSIYHFQLSEQEKEELSVGDHSIVNRINQWISGLKKLAPTNSLSIVVFCGRELSSNGVGFVHMNAQPPPQLIFKSEKSRSRESV